MGSRKKIRFGLYLLAILAGMLVIGIVVVGTRYGREMSAARERVKDLGSRVLETDRGSIEYVRRGDDYPALLD